jgi:hypothetical protein
MVFIIGVLIMHITITTIINSSVTAKQCVDLNSKYIYGKGFDFATDIVDKTYL